MLLLPSPHAEQIQLAIHVPPPGGGDAVHHLAENLHQLGAAVAHGVKGPALDQILHRPLVHPLVVEPVAEIHKVHKGAALLPLGQQVFDHAPADPLDGHQAKADAFLHHGKVGPGLVHVGGQDGNAHLPAGGDVLGHLLALTEDGGEPGRHILPGVVALKIGGLIAYNGVDQ